MTTNEIPDHRRADVGPEYWEMMSGIFDIVSQEQDRVVWVAMGFGIVVLRTRKPTMVRSGDAERPPTEQEATAIAAWLADFLEQPEKQLH